MCVLFLNIFGAWGWGVTSCVIFFVWRGWWEESDTLIIIYIFWGEGVTSGLSLIFGGGAK